MSARHRSSTVKSADDVEEFRMTALRILVITVGLPYPPFSGKDMRNWQNICALSRISRVGVFGLCANDPGGDVTPPRNLELWQRSSDAALSNPPPPPTVKTRAWPLDPMGHPSDRYYSDTTAREIGDVMVSFKPQIVVIEGLWLYGYIDILKQFHCRIVLDCHNVEAVVYQEIANMSQGDHLGARLTRKLLPTRTKLLEQKAVQAVDQVWVCSDGDARSLKDLYGTSLPVRIVPNGVDVTSYDVARTSRCHRPETSNRTGKALIFPAVFSWEPNIVAASFLINNFFPRLAAVFPDCRLLLAGARPTPEMIAAAE